MDEFLRPYRSPERLERELQSGSVGQEFQPMLPASLTTSTDVLSSFTAFIRLLCIIGKKRNRVKGKLKNALDLLLILH